MLTGYGPFWLEQLRIQAFAVTESASTTERIQAADGLIQWAEACQTHLFMVAESRSTLRHNDTVQGTVPLRYNAGRRDVTSTLVDWYIRGGMRLNSRPRQSPSRQAERHDAKSEKPLRLRLKAADPVLQGTLRLAWRCGGCRLRLRILGQRLQGKQEVHVTGCAKG